jgi:hypothetical protein
MQETIMNNFVQATKYDMHMYAKLEYLDIYSFCNEILQAWSCNNFTEGNNVKNEICQA